MIVRQWPDYLVPKIGDGALVGSEEAVTIVDSIDALIEHRAADALAEVRHMVASFAMERTFRPIPMRTLTDEEIRIIRLINQFGIYIVYSLLIYKTYFPHKIILDSLT